MRAAAASRPDIIVRDGVVDRAEQASIMHACDAYVSLHRAEGFGLTVPEALALGKPVISTAYSGTLETTTPANSWLVPYRLVPVGDGSPPYPADARWAEPDIAHAARAMREVFENSAEAAKRGRRAAQDMATLHGVAARARSSKGDSKRSTPRLSVSRDRAFQLRRLPRPATSPGERWRVYRNRCRPMSAEPVNGHWRRSARFASTDAPGQTPVRHVEAVVPDAGPLEPIGTNLGPMRIPHDEVMHPWVHHYLTWEEDIVEVLRIGVARGWHRGRHRRARRPAHGAAVGSGRRDRTRHRGRTGGGHARRAASKPAGPALHAQRGGRRGGGVGPRDHAHPHAQPDQQRRYTSAPGAERFCRAVVLDDWFAESDRLDLVKVDAQGSDHVALAGLAKTIARCRPLVVVEFDPGQIRAAGYDAVEVAEGYAALGLGVEVFETGHRDLNAVELVELALHTGDGFVTLLLGRT